MPHRSPAPVVRVRFGALLLAGAAALTALPGTAMATPTPGTRGSAQWTVVGGNGAITQDGFTDGTDALHAPLSEPGSVSLAPDGSIYLATLQRDEIVHIADGKVQRVAGGGATTPAEGVVARSANLSQPAVAVGPDGVVRFVQGASVFAIATDGTLDETPFTYPADLPHATGASLDRIDVDQLGRVFMIDRTTNAVLRIAADGGVTRIAGGGTKEPVNGGVAATANLGLVADVAGSPTGEVYLVGTYGGYPAVWRVGTDGKLKLYAGNNWGGWPTCSPAPQQTIQNVRTVATDDFGRVYVGSTYGIYKIQGAGQQQYLGDGGGQSIGTIDLAVGPRDELAITSDDHRVRRSPFVAEREGGCRAYPYLAKYQSTAAQDLVAAQYVRFRATATQQQKLDLADLIYRTTLDPADLVVDLEQRPGFAGPVGGTSRLYLASFGRPADTSGLRYWVGKKFAGATLASIATTFTQSSEFVRRYGSLGSGAFVDLVYQNVLGRGPDAAGRRHWVAKLDAGASRGSVMVAFSESSEFVRKTRVRTDATLTAYGLLGRAPSAAEVTMWTDRLAEGHTTTELVAWVWYSAEHADRVKRKLG